MAKQEGFFTAGLLLVSLFYLINSFQIPIGTLAEPGPGLLPIIVGSAGVLVSALILWNCFITNRSEMRTTDDSKGEKTKIKEVIESLIVLIITLALFDVIGALTGIAVLVCFLSKICGMRKWVHSFFLGVGSSLLVFIIFYKVFKVPLPKGFIVFL